MDFFTTSPFNNSNNNNNSPRPEHMVYMYVMCQRLHACAIALEGVRSFSVAVDSYDSAAPEKVSCLFALVQVVVDLIYRRRFD